MGEWELRHIKNFFYNISDLIVVLLILVGAAALILWRLDLLAAYPKTVVAESAQHEPATQEIVIEQSGSAVADSTETAQDSTIWHEGKLKMGMTVQIEEGGAEDAVSALVNAGLFASYEEFVSVCEKVKADPTSIVSGEYTFAAGSTQEDIVKEVTGSK